MKSQLDTSWIANLEVLRVKLWLKKEQSDVLAHNQVLLQVDDPLRTQVHVIIRTCCHLLFNRVKRISPLLWLDKAELVCNLALNFYDHLITFLVYFQAIKLSKRGEDVWAQNELYFQNWAESRQNCTLDFVDWFDWPNDLQIAWNLLHWKGNFLKLRMGWWNPL